MLTTGKENGFEAISNDDGKLAVLAIDQRDALVDIMRPAGLSHEPSDLSAFKFDMCRMASEAASAVLLDPEFGIGIAKADKSARPGSVGMLVTTESERWHDTGGARLSDRHPGRDAGYVKSVDGDALKFLVFIRPDINDVNGRQLIDATVRRVREVVDDCRASDVTCVVEALPYLLPGEDSIPLNTEDLVVESARILDQAGPDLLKLSYPGSTEACKRVTDTIDRPWAILSANCQFNDFCDYLKEALDEGASGYIAGRAIWREAAQAEGDERTRRINELVRPRLEKLDGIMSGRGRRWDEALKTG